MPLRGQRYGDSCDADFHQIVESMRDRSYQSANDIYALLGDTMDRRQKAFLACNDRFYFLTHVLGRVDAIHPWVYKQCRMVEKDPDGYLDLWSRYSYKTSIITTAGSLQEVACNPDVTIALFSVTSKVARKFLRGLQESMESNPTLAQLFPDVFWAEPRKAAPMWALDQGLIVRRTTTRNEPTLSAWGMVDGMPTGGHWDILLYNDIITEKTVTNQDMVEKSTLAYELSTNLGIGEGTRKWMEGTRYCTRGDQRVLMADWSHKPISEVVEGDVVVGWEQRAKGKRFLRPAVVRKRGCHAAQPTRKMTFSNGRSVVCTADHKWWRGPWGSGPEYAPLRLPAQGRSRSVGFHHAICQLLVPATSLANTREAGWLAGFYDGEGTFKQNPHHPSGVPCIVQSMANPELIEETRRVLATLGFSWTESWHSPSAAPPPKEGGRNQALWKDRCVFNLGGCWRERYRFLTEVMPVRSAKIAKSLFGQLTTEKFQLTADEDAGLADVHWLETETGNYVVEGFCSSNSFADSYGFLIEKGIVKPRVFPATHDGKEGDYYIDQYGEKRLNPVFVSLEQWQTIKREQRNTYAAQMLQNPLAGKMSTFLPASLRRYLMRPRTLNVYIMGDYASGEKKDKKTDYSAILAVGIDHAGNKYLLDGARYRMNLKERWQELRRLYLRWTHAQGVQMVRVGYEKYGAQSDIQYFEEQMLKEGEPKFPIKELNWPREGLGSKSARIQRLGPDFLDNKFYLPAKVWRAQATWWVDSKGREHAGLLPQGVAGIQKSGARECLWRVDTATDKIEYLPIPYEAIGVLRGEIVPPSTPKAEIRLTQKVSLMDEEREALKVGENYRITESLRRKDFGDGSQYDLTNIVIEELLFDPFSLHDDAIDCLCRIFDMEPSKAVLLDKNAIEHAQWED